MVPSSGNIVNDVLNYTLQENLVKDSYGIHSNFPYPTKTILDLLHSAYILHNTDLFQRTLKTLKKHLENLEERNDHITSLLSRKEEIRLNDKTGLTGTCFARLSLKAQASVRSAFANLPSELQVRILGSSDLHYSYYDYMDAFEKVFYYQNKKFDHSWLLMFDRKFSNTIPTWFLKWWEMFGLVPHIFPEPLQDALREFSVKRWDTLKIDTIIRQIAGKSSKELKDLAQQLLLQSKELQSQEKGSPVSGGSEGMKMCRDFKIQSQANKSKAKYEVGTFCTQYGLPPIAHSKRKSEHKRPESPEKQYRKRTKARYYRKKEYSNPKDGDFYKRGKPSRSKSTGRYEKSSKASGKCFNCGKKGHFRHECKVEAKTFINTLINDQTSKDKIFRLLELDHESTSSSSDHDIYQSSSFETPRNYSSSSKPRINLACGDSCCKNKSISTLNRKEESILDLIKQIEDPIIKAQKLAQFNKVKTQFKPKDRTLNHDLDISGVRDGILVNPKNPGSKYLSIIPFKRN
ncbi:hypothetical protein SO802_023949 [Lithocarpus litseifolius]|uniref:CCHC-type domain-containing protein n=1 Tax=Lithocarpus litseifolius TaxID=425828 RepID=A0AAW2C7J9_9ROSI